MAINQSINQAHACNRQTERQTDTRPTALPNTLTTEQGHNNRSLEISV